MGGVVLPDGPVGALGQAPAGAVGLVAAAECLPRRDRVRERLPDLVEHVAEAGAGVGVGGELARGRRVRDVPGARFREDAVVRDGEADDAPQVRFGEAGGGGAAAASAAFVGEGGEGDGAVDRDV